MRKRTYKYLPIFIFILLLSGVQSEANLKANYLVYRAPIDSIQTDKISSLLSSEEKQQPLKIIQIGDSHIQAGSLSQAIRDQIAKKYDGLSGRGWISPLRLCRTNGQNDYSISSTNKWTNSMLNSVREYSESTGPGGIILTTNSSSPNITIKSSDYPFDRIITYHSPENGLNFIPENSELGYSCASGPVVDGLVIDTLRLNETTRQITLVTNMSVHEPFKFAGCFISNTTEHNIKPIFSNIGLNGASYRTYLHPDYIRLLSSLHPDYLIISLGTNDSYSRRFSASDFRSTVLSFVNQVHDALPDCQIVFTTPPPCYFKRTRKVSIYRSKKRKKGKSRRRGRRYTYSTSYSFNNSTLEACKVLKDIATSQPFIGLIDLYDMMGGKLGSKIWLHDGYYAVDRVHFTHSGYYKQGELIGKEFVEKFLSQASN